METKANYALVGLFTILICAVVMIFAVWSASKGSAKNTMDYSIKFSGSVSGLSVGGDVRLSGIRIGEVKSIKFDRNVPGNVHVLITVDADAPIRENTEAVLNVNSLTGIATIGLSGGTQSSPILMPKAGESVATIKAGKSTLDSLLDEAPDIMKEASHLLHQANGLFTEENKENLRVTLESFAKVSATLAEGTESIQGMIKNLEKTGGHLGNISEHVDKTIRQDLAATMHSIREIAESLDKLVASVEPGIERFSGHTLDEVQRMVADAREVMRTLDALLQKVNTNPSRFIFGDNVPEFK